MLARFPFTAFPKSREKPNAPQHVRNDEKPHMATANVDLLEVADAPVAGRDGDVAELDVHVVLGWEVLVGRSFRLRSCVMRKEGKRTLNQLAPVCDARVDLEGDDVALVFS